MNFEASVKALEQIVKNLESGELSIEKSIEEFEKGIGLVKECRKLLDAAEKQVSGLIGEISNEKTED